MKKGVRRARPRWPREEIMLEILIVAGVLLMVAGVVVNFVQNKKGGKK